MRVGWTAAAAALLLRLPFLAAADEAAFLAGLPGESDARCGDVCAAYADAFPAASAEPGFLENEGRDCAFILQAPHTSFFSWSKECLCANGPTLLLFQPPSQNMFKQILRAKLQ